MRDIIFDWINSILHNAIKKCANEIEEKREQTEC